jgi:prephenate dehydrogenase
MERGFQKVAIIGLGLIGGSLAFDIKGRHLAEVVIGISRRSEVIDLARGAGAIDWGTTDLLKGVAGADLIFICTPIFSIVEIFKKIAGSLRPETVVSDAGSTKKFIMQQVAKLCPEKIYFIGGHPMAGSEKSGFSAARPDLFQNAVYILTPAPSTPVTVLNNFSGFLEKLGAAVVYLNAEEHDRITAAVSHLPYLVAVALAGSLLALPRHREFLKFAAGGLRDTTRVASSPTDVWGEICLTNRQEILKMLTILEKEIGQIKEALSKNNALKLDRILKKSFQLRQNLFT